MSPFFLFLSVSFSDCLPTYPPIYPPCIHLSLSLSVCLSVCLSIYLSIYLSVYLPVYLSTYLPIYLSISLQRWSLPARCLFHVSSLPLMPSPAEDYLSIYLSFYLSIYLSVYLSIDLSIYLSLSLSSVYQPIYLSIYLSVCLSISLSVCLSVCLSIYLQDWKRSYSARLPQFLNLTTSKNAAIQRHSLNISTWQRQKRSILQEWKVSADGLVPRSFAIFPIHMSKLLRLPRESDARSNEVLHLLRQIISANLEISGSKMHPLSRNQRRHLLTALMNMSLVLRLPRKMHLCRSCSNVPRLPSFLEMLQNRHVLLTFDKVHNPLRLPRESTSEPPKSGPNPGCF